MKSEEQLIEAKHRQTQNSWEIRPENRSYRHNYRQRKSLPFKITLLAVLIAVVPVFLVGTIASISNISAREQLSAAKLSWEVSKLEAVLDRQWLTLLLTTGAIASVAGAIAAYFGFRAVRPLIGAAAVSNRIVNRLRQEELRIRDRVAGEDELSALQANLKTIDEQLPELLWRKEAETEAREVLSDIGRHLRQGHAEEDVCRIAVAAMRQVFRTDRAIIVRFEDDWQGAIVEESVASGLPKTLWAKLDETIYAQEDLERYQRGRTRAIDNIYQADLGDRYIGFLERFAVKANLIAPILVKSKLFGLAIVHQCSSPREWQRSEIDLFSQVANQVGFALEQASLYEQLAAKKEQVNNFVELISRIRASLNEEDILRTTVEEVRKQIKADRVIVYGFDPDWYGTVLAESVSSSFPKTLAAKIKDPCFAEGYVEKYRTGRIHAIEDVEQAGLNECYLKQLRQFEIKANLVAPILKDDKLFGLLIAHQCAAPRHWHQEEIELLSQIAIQVGYTLDHARLLQQIDTEKMQNETIYYIGNRIGESIDENEILKTTVEEVRKELRVDRVVVYNFNDNWSGYISSESVIPGWQHALDRKIEDPCIPEHLRQAYINGRIVPTNNVFEAGFHPAHLQLMESLQIKSNLVAPILENGQLFGLLIAHQCSGFRNWQTSEINFMSKIAMQLGFAIDRARLITKVETERGNTQLLGKISQSIRASLNEENVLKTTVEEVRRAFKTDRVIVYSFDPDWYGTVIAESVLPGYPKAFQAKIKDPCFAEGYVESYQAGRVQATDNIYEAGLTECHIQQLEPFRVKANLVAPILKDDRLFGLLIAHHCSETRHWQQSEIQLFAQIALQVGFALDHARLLTNLERNYQSEQTISHDRLQELTKLLTNSQTEVKTLASQTQQSWELVNNSRDRAVIVANSARTISETIKQVQNQQQQLEETLALGISAIEQIVDRAATMHATIFDASEKIEQITLSCRQLTTAVEPIVLAISQLKLQAMNAMLEATRNGEAGQPLAAVAEEVRSLAKQLEDSVSAIEPLLGTMQTNTEQMFEAIVTETDPTANDPQIIATTQAQLDRLNQVSTQLTILLQELLHKTKDSSQNALVATDSILEAIAISEQSSKQSSTLAVSFEKITAIARELQNGQ
ncbi:MAG: GAF domain-containing protein [Xenococcaceae cyanobacterium]